MTSETRLAADTGNPLAAVIAALQGRGLTVVRGFDLRSALTLGAGGPCPDHGTDTCHCQYAVLLVYGPGPAAGQPPVTVTFHSRAATWLEIGRDANAQPDPALTESIWAALADVVLPEGITPLAPADGERAVELGAVAAADRLGSGPEPCLRLRFGHRPERISPPMSTQVASAP